MTVAGLATILQTWAHEGHAEDKVMIKLYDGMYKVKDVTKEAGAFLDLIKFREVNVFAINAESLSNER